MIYVEICLKKDSYKEEDLIGLYMLKLPSVGDFIVIKKDADWIKVKVKQITHYVDKRSNPSIGVDQQISIDADKVESGS